MGAAVRNHSTGTRVGCQSPDTSCPCDIFLKPGCSLHGESLCTGNSTAPTAQHSGALTRARCQGQLFASSGKPTHKPLVRSNSDTTSPRQLRKLERCPPPGAKLSRPPRGLATPYKLRPQRKAAVGPHSLRCPKCCRIG